MTFEEWFVERYSNPDDDCYDFSKEAWDAAIEAAQEILSKGEYYWPASSDYGPDRPEEAEPLAEFAIEILKTK